MNTSAVNPRAVGPARCSGALAQLAVADVVQLLQLIGKSAVMTVTVAHEGGQSRLWCAEGSMVDAESGRLRGEAAAYRILSLEDGWLEAELRHEDRPRTIHAPTQRLLLEAARRTDETLALKRKLGGVQCCYRLVHEPEPEQLAAPTAAELRMLRLLSSAPSVGELLAESELGDLETLVTLERWFEAGHLARVGLRPEGAEQPLIDGKLEASPVLLASSALPSSPLLAPSSSPSPSVPPLVASVPPPRRAAQSGARGTSRSASLAAGAVLLAAASFAGGYVLRDGAARPATGTAALQAGEPLDAPADREAVAASTQAGAAGAAQTAAGPGDAARNEPATLAQAAPAVEVAPPGVAETELEADDAAPEHEVSSGAVAKRSPGAREAAPATRPSRSDRPAARLSAGRSRAAAAARGVSPVISEPRVRVIGAAEPSIRVLE